ncbi:MAG: type I-E CRISPR-associated protein Cas5/CasD [Thiomicrorhabdus chilensis]|uniref:type I-E CRISPR-associated protein Cas5/CasD n=1 Tax=Thiomicrorhabdus chilensis TaxID=63656 RepID=UPI00299EC1C1|nr:type I-E CRISPR-associated protein Cas5/CasD [Thiomicrorhabdus chilensis]MDX1348097.1 type I-E CRISPR-associated protein Cas5/CasD [Thiomicrorhabdus chilensis]
MSNLQKNDPYVLLWFEAPLQAWGADSKFGRRDTLKFPTKSGVLGLVFSAMGAAGEQCELLARFAPLDMQVISYRKTKANGNKQDKQPLMRDFQTVGNGYEDKDPWQTLLIPKTADGKKAVGGGSKLTYRYYLQDAVFAVALQVPSALSVDITKALQSPSWDIYLGRKNCIPTELVFQGQFANFEDLNEQACSFSQLKNLVEDFRVAQGEIEGDEHLTLNDVAIQFGQHKKYRDRQVTLLYTQEEWADG